MKFEEVLPLMREGKICVDSDGTEWKISNPNQLSLRYKNGNWMSLTVPVSREFTLKEEPKYQWLFRYKCEADWILTSSRYGSEEDVRAVLTDPDYEFRRFDG